MKSTSAHRRGGRRLCVVAAVVCGLAVVLVAPPVRASDGPVYPADTSFFRPFARAHLGLSLSADSGGSSAGRLGGGLTSGLVVSSTRFGDAAARVSAGYRYLPGSATETVSLPFLGLGGGYRFSLWDLLGIVPAAGVNFSVPVEGDEVGFAPELVLETTAQLHLYERSFLTMHTGITVPVASPAPASVFVGFGISRSHPVMVPLPEVEPQLTVSPTRFSPDGDGYRDELEIRIETESQRALSSWALRIYDPRSHLFYSESGDGAPPSRITWGGRSEEGELVSSASDYTVELAVTDRVGRTTVRREELTVDILVIREDGRLKVRIPSITFPPNSADLGLLEEAETIAKNRQVFSRLAELFRTFPEYSILIEGHANMEYFDDPERAEREQEEVLIPLSRERAEVVKSRLAERGIEADRMSAVGVGAESPVVPFSDEENRWKNRRVEFILIRPEGAAGGREAERETTRE